MHFGCNDDEDDDAARCASADEDDDDVARWASADDVAGCSLTFEITIGSESDAGVGGHIVVNGKDNNNDNGNHIKTCKVLP